MRIGVDIDGVLADFNRAFIDLIVQTTGKDLFPERPFDIPTWNYPQHYGYTDAEIGLVWTAIAGSPEFWRRLPGYVSTRPDLVFLRYLALKGVNDVYFVTARLGLTAKAQTEDWLRAYGFYDPTVLISSQKGMIAHALKLDVYIDDRIENVNEVAALKSCRTFVLDRPWNHAEIPNAERVLTVTHALKLMLHDDVARAV